MISVNGDSLRHNCFGTFRNTSIVQWFTAEGDDHYQAINMRSHWEPMNKYLWVLPDLWWKEKSFLAANTYYGFGGI